MSARIFLCRTLLMALLLVISACKPDMIPQPDKTFPELTNWLTEQKAQITYGLSGQTPDMPTAFKQGYILIYGEGVPKQGIDHAGQRRLTAQRAAEVVAQRNLAFVLSQGNRYGSVRFDTYSAPIKPLLRDFQIVIKEYNNEAGKAAVLIKYDLRGATRFLR